MGNLGGIENFVLAFLFQLVSLFGVPVFLKIDEIAAARY